MSLAFLALLVGCRPIASGLLLERQGGRVGGCCSLSSEYFSSNLGKIQINTVGLTQHI